MVCPNNSLLAAAYFAIRLLTLGLFSVQRILFKCHLQSILPLAVPQVQNNPR